MPELTTEERLKGLEYANKLSLLAAEAPDLHTENATHEFAKMVQKRFTYSFELRKREILTHLKKRMDVGLSIAELIEATGYEKNTIYALAEDLEKEKRARFQRIRPAGSGPGRPAVRLFYVPNEANFSAQKS